MPRNPIGHVDLRVHDREVARAFYGALLPELGLAEFEPGDEWDCFNGEGEPPFRPWLAYIVDRDHVPNANRVAFAAASREEVDRLTEVARRAGAQNISEPRVMTEYNDGYYASFFDDPFGNPLEIVHTSR